jgi:hypothetical protein
MLLGIAGQAWEAEYSGVNQKKLVKTLSRPQKLEVSHLQINHLSKP